MSPVQFWEMTPPPVNRKEIFRILHVTDPRLEQVVEECLEELLPLLTYRVCFASFPIVREEEGLNLGFVKTPSENLAKHLDGCSRVTVFAATLGVAPDRLIARHEVLSPLKALCIDGIATERIEGLCDAFQQRIGWDRPRFSPGYGDLPLETQRDLFRALHPEKIGLTLNESLLMSPSKSVTAIIGK